MRIEEHAAEAVMQKSMWGGAVTGLIGWLGAINWLGLAGVLIAFLGMAGGLYFQIRRDRREEREHQAKMQALQNRAPHRKGDIPDCTERLLDE